jgi:glucose/arabinose dehydrogenase
VVTDTYGGFDRPWELVFLPDGTALASERPGRLVRIVGGSRVVVAAVPGVHAAGEGGLMGMAVDPGFASNRRVYLCHASTAAGVPDVRIVRYRVAEDYSGIGEQTPLLTGIPAGVGDRHLGCRLGIGPDGMLWATTGDAVQPTAPQDPTDLAGKVLRMTLDGAPAPGNPGGAWHPLVYSIGHRNPQGLAFRPGDGAVFVAEHGTGCDDEVNRIVAGANYGWNPDGGGSYLEGAPMTFPGATPAVWASGCPTIAPSGATFVDGPGWRGWQGRLVMAVLKGQRLRFVAIDGSAVTAVDDRLTDQGRLRAVRLAPDGSLWVAQDRSPGAVMRLVPK